MRRKGDSFKRRIYMKIIEKLKKKKMHRTSEDSITVVCLGDSVTEGCFEAYIDENGNVATVFDRNHSYAEVLKALLARLYPTVQVNIVNSGVSGDSAAGGVKRLARDVLRFQPDLVIVSYGLNDCGGGYDGLPAYEAALSEIFEKVTQSGAEVIFLTENCMCTYVSPHFSEERLRETAEWLMDKQSKGFLDAYFDKAKEVAARYGVKVCDLYSVWKSMQESGINVTELLANKLNHPIREYHYYIAVKLFETMMEP